MSDRKPPSNYEERDDGYHKIGPNPQGGNASYYERPLVTSKVVNTDLHKRADGSTDWNSYYEERKKVGLSK